MTTSITPYSQRQALDDGLPGRVENALNDYDLGSAMRKIKATIAAMTAASTQDITAIPAAKITVNEGPAPIRTSGVLPPIQMVQSLRVSASGTGATVGSYFVSDAGGTAVSAATSGAAGIALLSDDGKSLTFPTTVTGFVIEYYMRPGCALVKGVWVWTDQDATPLAGTQDGIGA